MNMTDVATWGQLISSAAVLITLVYLSAQTGYSCIPENFTGFTGTVF